MNKIQFLNALREKLSGLSAEDLAERLAFYSEAIDDRVEDGLTEEEAVAQLGSIDEITGRIIGDVPVVVAVKEKRRVNPWVIVLLVLGSPLWISLLAAAFAVVVSLFASVWSVIVCLWAAEVSVAVSSVGCLAGGIWFFCTGNVPGGFAALGVSVFCAGFSLFGHYGCVSATKGTAWLTKKSVLWIIGLFKRKEGAK